MKRILVIEDNEANIYLVRFILEKSGHEVIEARDGASGVARAREPGLDLILVDIQLPDIDGLEVTRRIRGSGADQTVPIVALTSYAMAGDREKALAAGCAGYIEKPIDPDTFMTELQKYF
ncbi:MAG: response regulator [Deltaproteobacteria bacterium]|nr:response regulator [Deltaproteobacteria bacterium]